MVYLFIFCFLTVSLFVKGEVVNNDIGRIDLESVEQQKKTVQGIIYDEMNEAEVWRHLITRAELR